MLRKFENSKSRFLIFLSIFWVYNIKILCLILLVFYRTTSYLFSGTFILRSTATDYEGDEIVYSIEGDQNGFFQINPENGDLQTAKIIDRESLVSIYFIIFYPMETFIAKQWGINCPFKGMQLITLHSIVVI